MNRPTPPHLVLLLTLLAAAPVVAQPDASAPTLQVSPNRCIALHQGQPCYLKTTLRWSAPQRGAYCLHQVNLAEPLQCWVDIDHGNFAFEIQSAEGVRFELRASGSANALADAEVEVAWVYTARRRSKANWRLF